MNQPNSPVIAHIALDLPVEGHFDYIIPDGLQGHIEVGMRVMVPFGSRQACGYVVGLAQQSKIAKLKSINSRCEPTPSISARMMDLARDFARHYGASLGEALSAMLPLLLRQGRSGALRARPALPVRGQPSSIPALLLSASGDYMVALRPLIQKALASKGSVLFLVPDGAYVKQYKALLEPHFNSTPMLIDDSQTQVGQLNHWLKVRGAANSIVIGTRSAVFAPLNDLGLVVMIDEDNASFKQEQSPLYETRDVLLMRARLEAFNIVFCSATPSVDLWQMVKEGKVKRQDITGVAMPLPVAVDLNDYKFIPGLLSVPLRNGIEATLKQKGKAILILNRRGSYAVSRCQDCGKTLTCAHCDSALIFSKLKNQFLCNHCTFALPGNAPCAHCHKVNWKFVRMGIEQLQGELTKYFPTARIASFDGEDSQEPKAADILIATQAILRFKGKLKAQLVGMIDFNAEINRLDANSSFKAFSLARQLNAMATSHLFVQTRNNEHYVIKSLIRQDLELYYEEELALRKELGFAPFKHWVRLMLRSKNEKIAQEMAQAVYNELITGAGKQFTVMSPAPDAVFKKRDQYRYNLSVQGEEVVATMDLVKAALAKVKRYSRVIVTLNVD